MLVALSLEATATGNLPGAGLSVEVAMLKKLDTRFTFTTEPELAVLEKLRLSDFWFRRHWL